MSCELHLASLDFTPDEYDLTSFSADLRNDEGSPLSLKLQLDKLILSLQLNRDTS